jgi:hypothetical protein
MSLLTEKEFMKMREKEDSYANYGLFFQKFMKGLAFSEPSRFISFF